MGSPSLLLQLIIYKRSAVMLLAMQVGVNGNIDEKECLTWCWSLISTYWCDFKHDIPFLINNIAESSPKSEHSIWK